MDDKTTPKYQFDQPQNKGSSGWAVFWTAVFITAGFAGAGVFFNERLELLERKLTAQNEQVAIQSEDALKGLHNARKEILDNRTETALLAKQFNKDLEKLSSLLSQTLDTVSQNNTQLVHTVEQKQQSQGESLQQVLVQMKQSFSEQAQSIQAKVDRLALELGEVKGAVLAVNTQTQYADSRLASLREQVAQLDGRVQSLNAEQENYSKNIVALLDRQEERLSASEVTTLESLAALQSDVTQLTVHVKSQDEAAVLEMQSISEHLLALANASELTQAAGLEANEVLEQQLAEMSAMVIGQSENILQALADSQQSHTEQQAKLQDSLAAGLECASNSLTKIQSDLETTKFTGFSVQDMVRKASLLTNAQNLQVSNGLQIIVEKTDIQARTLQESIAQLGGQMQQVNHLVNEKTGALVQMMEVKDNAGACNAEKRSQVAERMKIWQTEMKTAQENLTTSVAKAQESAAVLVDQPESAEALQAFHGALQALNDCMDCTQKQYATMGELITLLSTEPAADQISQTEAVCPNPTNTSIGMAVDALPPVE